MAIDRTHGSNGKAWLAGFFGLLGLLLAGVILLVSDRFEVGFLPQKEQTNTLADSPVLSVPGLPDPAPSVASSARTVQIPVRAGRPAHPLVAFLPRGEAVRVLFVDESDGTPLPGAAAAWRCEELAPPWSVVAPELFGADPGALAWATGVEVVADREGAITVPRLPWSLQVVAAHGELAGGALLPPGAASPQTIVLGRVGSVEIEVLDRQGQPRGGVPVVLYAASGEDLVEIWRGTTTEPEGRTRACFSPGRSGLFQACLHAGFSVLLSNEPPVPVPVDRKVLLFLPAAGRIEVVLVDRDGSRWREPTLVRIAPDGSDQDGAGRVGAREGQALFPHVGLGQRWSVWAESLAGLWVACREDVSGPTTPGEQVTIEISVPGVPGPLRGRLVDGDGKPLAHALVYCDWAVSRSWAGMPLEGVPFRTDREGRFSLLMPGLEAQGTAWLWFHLWLTTGVDGKPQGPWGQARVDRPLAPQGLELGDVTLAGSLVTVKGTLTAQGGQPIQGALVYCETGPSPARGLSSQAFLQGTLTDADGRFQLTLTDQTVVYVSAEAWGYDPLKRVPYFFDRRELRLRLMRTRDSAPMDTGAIPVRLLLDPGIPREGIRVRAHAKPHLAAEGTAAQAWDFLIEGVAPGTWTVLVESCLGTLARVEGVQVQAGGFARDRRLLPVDLRGRLRAFRFRALDETLNPVRQGLFLGLPPGEKRGTVIPVAGDREGAYVLAIPSSLTAFAFGAHGFGPVRHAWTPGERQLALERGPRPEVRIVAPQATLGRFVLTWALEPVGFEPWERLLLAELGQGRVELRPGREPTLLLPLPGCYRFALQGLIPGRSGAIALPRSSPGVIEVPRGKGVLDLRIDAEELHGGGR